MLFGSSEPSKKKRGGGGFGESLRGCVKALELRRGRGSIEGREEFVRRFIMSLQSSSNALFHYLVQI